MDDIIFKYIIPISGLVLGFFGVIDRIVIAFRFLSRRRDQRKLKLAQKDFEDLNQFNDSTNYLIAYQFKQLLTIIVIVLFTSVITYYPIESKQVFNNITNILMLMIWLGGFFTGRAFRSLNYVLKREVYERRIKARIEKYSERCNALI